VKAREEAYDRERDSNFNVAAVPAPAHLNLSRRHIANCRPVEKGPSVFVPLGEGVCRIVWAPGEEAEARLAFGCGA
jgi:hypothetical protein